MTIRKIAEIGHPVLRERARELTLAELRTTEWQTFIDDLVETMRDADGAGIAANQVYISQWQVKIDGAAIEALNHDLLRVEVDRAIFMPGMATIEVFDRLLKWTDDSRFAIGKTVVLSVKGAIPNAPATELFS